MRDLVLLAALIGILPIVMRAPQVGILAWIWVTLLNPQREVYGFLSGFELNYYIAIATALAWVISREKKTVPFNLVTGFMLLFGLWTCITTYLALQPDYSAVIWERTMKSLVLALAVLTLANNKARIQSVIWAVALALGYYAVKGGGFVLLTGGRHHVYGPARSMIEDNNALGLALVMVLPLLNYLRVTSRSKLTSYASVATMGLTLIAIIGTYSRGALLALAASAVAYAVKSRSGLIPLLLGGILIVSLPTLMPSSWFDRMATIQSYNQDTSFEGRVAAWKTSFDIARQRPFVGGGFSSVDLDWVALAYHSPGSLTIGKAAHSIYFEVLGDHGFVGLVFYLLLIASAWYNTAAVLIVTRARPELDWANRLARMLQISIIGYLVGGAALSMAYYDGFLILLAVTAALAMTVRQSSGRLAKQNRIPRWKEIAEHGRAAAVQATLRNLPQAALSAGRDTSFSPLPNTG